MNRRRAFSLLALALAVGAGILALHVGLGSSSEHHQIKLRYEAMQAAMPASDTNAARLVFAPAFRNQADDNFTRFHIFARPLGLRSKISVNGVKATICPARVFPIGMAGHTIEMIKVDDEWYFTGHISVF
jgi:hypothetical protein